MYGAGTFGRTILVFPNVGPQRPSRVPGVSNGMFYLGPMNWEKHG